MSRMRRSGVFSRADARPASPSFATSTSRIRLLAADRFSEVIEAVRRLVHEMGAGATHRELQERVRARVHNTLLTLLRRGEIERERLAQLYVYLHRDAAIREEQIQRRGALLDAAETVRSETVVPDEVVIQVLLTLLYHPGAKAAEVVRHLRGHSPPVTMEQVEAVFARYDLASIGKKGGSSQS